MKKAAYYCSVACLAAFYVQAAYPQSSNNEQWAGLRCAPLADQVKICKTAETIRGQAGQSVRLPFILVNEGGEEISVPSRFGVFDTRATDEAGNKLMKASEVLQEKLRRRQPLSYEESSKLVGFYCFSGPGSIRIHPFQQTKRTVDLGYLYDFTEGLYHFQIWKKNASKEDTPLLEFEVEIK
jgi:hypothetical protein